MLSAFAIGGRGFQLLFAIVVLGLSATLVKAQVYGNPPTTTTYSSFTGGFGILVAIVGIVGLFFEFIPALVPMALDAVLGLLFLAGGIAWAVGLKNANCNNPDNDQYIAMLDNGLLNGGTLDIGNGPDYGIAKGLTTEQQVKDKLVSVCKQAYADEVFQFISFATAVVILALGFVIMRKGGPSTSRPSYVA